MPAPLSNRQKAYLAQLARSAYAKTGPHAEDFEDWRHETVRAACGKLGLKCATQLDYKLIEARLLDLCGETQRAFAANLEAATEPRRQAEAVLVRTCEKFGLKLDYANAICLRQYHCSIFDASERQIRSLIYTVTTRGRAKQKSEVSRQQPAVKNLVPALETCTN